MTAPDPTNATGATALVDLRILATSDLHMHLAARDDFTGRPAPGRALAAVATLIARQRAAHPNTILLDNGDVLDGAPAADFIDTARPHPMIAAMNATGYDAGTLGNHDFDRGPAATLRALEQARFGIALTNATLKGAEGVIAPFVILDREMTDRAGATRRLKIGIMGFVLPRTTDWNWTLARHLRIADPVEAARAAIPRLRAAGADLIVVLCHSGIGARQPTPLMEHAATALAALDGIDALVAGHTHLVFPGPDHDHADGVDPVRGTLCGKPAVMPGFWGSHLGVIDLALRETPDGWTVVDRAARVEQSGAAPPAALPAPVVRTLADAATRMSRPLARTARPIHTHLALLGHDPASQLLARAQAWHVRRSLRGRAAALPVLSIASPGRAGGRSGPDSFTDIPPGPLATLALSDLCPWTNRLCAVEASGADLADWLERAASIFRRIVPGGADQPLIDARFPTYNFDVIHGLDWRIDLTRPARHAPDGSLADPSAHRILDLRHSGRAVAPSDRFVIATHSFRVAQGGMYGALASGLRPVLDAGPPLREVLRRYLARRRRLDDSVRTPWRFAPLPGTTALFDTGPGALAHLDAAPVRCEPAGMTADGFATLRLHL